MEREEMAKKSWRERIVLGFRIYAVPIAVWYAVGLGIVLAMRPWEIEGEREREMLFGSLECALNIGFFYYLMCRYEKTTGKSVGRRCKVMVGILSAVMILGIAMMAVQLVLGAV